MNYSTTMAMHILIFIIMLVYSVMAPLIIVFGVIYFVLALLAARYDIIFVSKQEWQGGGSFWPITFHMLIVGLLIFQGVMVGYLSILKFALVPLLLGAPLLTVLYWGWVHFYVYPPTEYGYVGQYYTPLQIPEEETKVEFQDQDQDQGKENHSQDHADSHILELDLDSQDSQEQSSDRDIELDKCGASPDDDDGGLLLYVQPDLRPLANPIAALQLLENSSPENLRHDVDDEQDQEEKEAEADDEDDDEEERTEMKRNSKTKREEKGKGQEDPHGGGTTRFG